MGIENGADSVSAAVDALESATMSLASDLQHDFSRAARQDDFIVSFNRLREAEEVVLLGLSQGLVVANPALSVKAARSPALFGIDEIDVTAQMMVDAEKGAVAFYASAIDLGTGAPNVPRRYELGEARWYFRVVYSAGFEASAEDSQLYDAVPDWLSQLAVMQARVSLNSHPTFVANMSTTDAKPLAIQIAATVAHRTRYLPWAQLPVMRRKT